jgi:hypothetical protein
VLVPVAAVGAVGTPVRAVSIPLDLVAIAAAMLLNSISISVPLTIFKGLPEARASLLAKEVLLT